MLFEIPSVCIAHRSFYSILPLDNFIIGIVNTPYCFSLCAQNRSNVDNQIAVLNDVHIFISWKGLTYMTIDEARPSGQSFHIYSVTLERGLLLAC